MKKTIVGSALLCSLLATSLIGAETDDKAEQQAAVDAVTVLTATPEVRRIDYTLSALGSVESLNQPTLSAETSGRVTSLLVDVGSRVEARQKLASIDNTLHKIQVAETRAELKRQTIALDNQRREVERLKRLAKSQSVSRDRLEDQQDQLSMLQAQRDVAEKRHEHARHMESRTRVSSPQAGSISKRFVSPGDYVSPGQPLFELVTIQRLRARLSFPEQDAASISIGQEVLLHSPAAPDKTAKGNVAQINPLIDAQNRAIEVIVEFDNPGGWYPGGSVDATLIIARNTNAFTVPRLSVVSREGRDVVFVVRDDLVIARPVALGWQEPGWVEITEGLEANERIVVQGAALLSHNSRIREVAAR